MKYYGDLHVTVEKRIRIYFDSDKKPTKKTVLQMLQDREFEDITDEETLEYLSVEKIDVEQI